MSSVSPCSSGTDERFVSRVIPDVHGVVRTRPLEALVIGACVRGLSDRDIERLMDEAGLGHISKNTASQLCRELRARYAACCAKSVAEVELLVLFLDAVYLPTRPSGAKEGVPVAWGDDRSGERMLLAVRLGHRESREDWLDLGAFSPDVASVAHGWSSVMAHLVLVAGKIGLFRDSDTGGEFAGLTHEACERGVPGSCSRYAG